MAMHSIKWQCTVTGIHGTDVSNAVKAVRIAMYTIRTGSVERTLRRSIKQRPDSDIRCQRTEKSSIRYKAVKCSVSA